MFIRKKGGKLDDKWLGPYLVDKVNPTNLHIYRNKSIQRVKKYKAILWKIQSLKSLSTGKQLRLDNDSENITTPDSDEDSLIVSQKTLYTPLTHSEGSREEVLKVLGTYKSKIINFIKNSEPISQLRSELHSRLHLSFREILDWRLDNYPPQSSPDGELIDFDTTQEISDILVKYYLESNEIKIPEYQYTSQDFEFATKWDTNSINYTTKVLLPVVEELLATHFSSDVPSKSKSPQLLSTSHNSQVYVEDICVTWGGHYNGVELVNTCSIDNFITLLSLHQAEILAAFDLTGEFPNSTLQFIFSMIQERSFDKLRLWAAPKLGIPIIDCKCDLLGYEGKMVQFTQENHFCQDIYRIVEKKLNLTSVLTFISNCQTSIDHQISASFNCLKCRDLNANIECVSREFSRLDILILVSLMKE